MEKNNIIDILEKRAREQQILYYVPFPKSFIFLSSLLGENPWKVFIPLAFGLTLFLHIIWGELFDTSILRLFRTL